MTCREFVEFLNAYLNGDLTPAERAEFERHLAVCPACVRYLQSYETTTVLTQATLAADARDASEAPGELIEAILAARRLGE